MFRYGDVAVKRPLLQDGKAFRECLRINGMTEVSYVYRRFQSTSPPFKKECVQTEIKGFLAEISLLQQLQGDPNVPKARRRTKTLCSIRTFQLFAYCIPIDLDGNSKDLAVVVELGKPVDLITYIDLGWQKRVQFVDQVLGFVERVRPLILLDFRRQQVCQMCFYI